MLRAALLILLSSLSASVAGQSEPAWPGPPAQFTSEDWIARWPNAEAVLLQPAELAVLRQRALAEDPALVDLTRLPEAYPVERLRQQIEQLLPGAATPRYRAGGALVETADLERWRQAANLDSLIGDSIESAWALLTRRAAVRAVPSLERIHADPQQTDIDRLQESALFPGDVVAVLHSSADGRWRFVQSENYAGWVADGVLAQTDRATALDYRARSDRMIVAAQARLAYTPEAPALSELRLDMGVRLPEWQDWPWDRAVNGQGVMAAHVLQLPTRDGQGLLQLRPALLPRSQASRIGPLPASRANLLRQAYRFLGERYGWGHDYGSRDCSGFVAEVYRSIGLTLPRNSGDQARMPAHRRTEFSADSGRAERLAALAGLAPGDLAYLPGHVVMLVGFVDGEPWVIHDVHEGRIAQADGSEVRFAINGVAVTPLRPLRTSSGLDYVEAITDLQQLLPFSAERH